jgi:hypothetical protein
MEVGVECKDLTTLMDQKFPFMEEHQVGSKRWFRKFLEGLVQE